MKRCGQSIGILSKKKEYYCCSHQDEKEINCHLDIKAMKTLYF